MSVPPKFRLKEGWSTLILLWAMLLVASSAIVQTNLIEGLRKHNKFITLRLVKELIRVELVVG